MVAPFEARIHYFRNTFYLGICYYYFMTEVRHIIAVIAIILTFIGYIPYDRDIIKGSTKPHIFSWFVWGLVTLIVFALQVYGGAGVASLVTLCAALMCIGVIFLGIRHRSISDITKTDIIFFLGALISVGVWIFAKQPILSAILATTIDILAFIPTIRKSWHKPYTETLSMTLITTFRFGLVLISLDTYSLLTTLYPVTWLLGNGLFSIMLILRRKAVGKR